jgi:hypothetical protein
MQGEKVEDFMGWYIQYQNHINSGTLLSAGDATRALITAPSDESLWQERLDQVFFEQQLGLIASGQRSVLMEAADEQLSAPIMSGDEEIAIGDFSHVGFLFSTMGDLYRSMTVWSTEGEVGPLDIELDNVDPDLKKAAGMYHNYAPVVADLTNLYGLATILQSNAQSGPGVLRRVAVWQGDIALLAAANNNDQSLHRPAISMRDRYYKLGRGAAWINSNASNIDTSSGNKHLIFSKKTLSAISAVACWKFPELVIKHPELANDFDQIFDESETIGSDHFMRKATELIPVFESLFNFYMLGFGRLIAQQISTFNPATKGEYYPPFPPMFKNYHNIPNSVSDWKQELIQQKGLLKSGAEDAA